MARLNLSPPWITYYRQLNTFFAEDPEVRVIFDDTNEESGKCIIKLYVNNIAKAEALEALLPKEKTFGSIKVYVMIIPANTSNKNSLTLCKYLAQDGNPNYIRYALDGNGAVNHIETINNFMSMNATFVIFSKKVVQYYTDSINDYFGMCSTLYQDLAKEIFGNIDGVFFCTDVNETKKHVLEF